MEPTFPMQRGIVCNPALDGLDHCNVWSKASTELGRMLSNMAPIGVTVPTVGHFVSMESYWWFRATGSNNPLFKNLNGFEARKLGKSLPVVKTDDFRSHIEEALTIKITQNKYLFEMLKESTLPLTHYYVYGNPLNKPKVMIANGSLWQLDHILRLRDSNTS